MRDDWGEVSWKECHGLIAVPSWHVAPGTKENRGNTAPNWTPPEFGARPCCCTSPFSCFFCNKFLSPCTQTFPVQSAMVYLMLILYNGPNRFSVPQPLYLRTEIDMISLVLFSVEYQSKNLVALKIDFFVIHPSFEKHYVWNIVYVRCYTLCHLLLFSLQ